MLCRACARECDEYKFLHVEGLILGKVTTLALLLNFCAGLEFSEEEDMLPEQICLPCMQKLAKACAFKQMVLEVDELFRSEHLKVSNDGEEWGDEDDPVKVEEISTEEFCKLESDERQGIDEAHTPPDDFTTEETVMHQEEIAHDVQDANVDVEDEEVTERVRETLVLMLEQIDEEVIQKNEDKGTEREEQTLEMMLSEVIEKVEVDDELIYEDAEAEEEGQEFLLEVMEAEDLEVDVTKEMENQHCVTAGGDMLAINDYEVKQFLEEPRAESTEVSEFVPYEPELNHSADSELTLSSKPELKQSTGSELSKSSESELPNSEEFCEESQEINLSEPHNAIQVEQFRVELDESMGINASNYESLEQKDEKDDGQKKHSNKDPNLKCQVCSKYFKSAKTYKGHMKRHDPFNPKSCEFCGKTYREIETLRKHLLSHTGEKPLSCGICGRNFRFRSNLVAHIRQHTGEKPFKCEQCDRCFGTKRHLTRHEAVHSDERPYVCDLCGKAFAQLRYLDLHKIRHTGVKPCQCHICGKAVSRPSELKKHFLTHTGEKPYKCDICGKDYRDQTNLRVHKRAHTGDRPYECPYCEKNYLTSTQLKAHTMIHTGERPHSCELCGKSYRVMRSLQRHMLTHTGAKQFKCDICGFEFRYESNLITHKRLHDREDAKCPHCEKTFRTPKLLRRHISVRHTQNETAKRKRKPSKRQHNNTKGDLELKPQLPDVPDQKVSKSNIVELY